MKLDELDLIQGALPGLQTFHHPEDGLSRQILGWVAGDGARIADLKKSRFGRLLDRPGIKEMLAKASDGILTHTHTALCWQRRKDFVITLDRWGGRAGLQMSRRGYNLVIQLNFPKSHEGELKRFLGKARGLFEIGGHPISKKRITLAWARVDLNLDTGQALIEELQNDWLRLVRRWAVRFPRMRNDSRYRDLLVRRFGERLPSLEDFSSYAHRMGVYEKIWAEAMLAATLKVVVDQIGIRDVFLHTPESGARFKGIHGTLPPRSLYSALPKKACFEKGQTLPEFLQGHRIERSKGRRRKKKQKKTIPVVSEMWRLNLNDQECVQ
jgi:hypothetical protein